MNEDSITLADVFIIAPFAWVLSQSILYGSIFWGVVALVMFNVYVRKRSNMDE